MIAASHMERMRARFGEVESALADPAVASQSGRRREMMAEYARLREILSRAAEFDRLRDELEASRAMAADPGADADLRALAQEEVAALEPRLPAAERALLVALLPPDPAESRNIIMEIRAGTGGEEAALFAADLFRMYSRYADRRGWRLATIDASASDIGGFKEIIFSVEGENVYRHLRYESGVHRVQRVPATEQQGRIHTSAATVAVLPDADEIDEIEIKPEEIRQDLYRASGPGGQKVNKTESAVRLTHLPTGLVVQSQDERSQQRNKEKAMRVLKARLLDLYRTQDAARTGDMRRSQIGSGDRSERIRTYNFPQNRLTDHRIELTLYQLDRIIEGDLDPVIGPLQARDLQERLKTQVEVG